MDGASGSAGPEMRARIAKDADAAPAVMVSDAGQAIAAALAGMGRARVPALLVAGMAGAGMIDIAGTVEPCRRAYWRSHPAPNGGRRRCRRWWRR